MSSRDRQKESYGFFSSPYPIMRLHPHGLKGPTSYHHPGFRDSTYDFGGDTNIRCITRQVEMEELHREVQVRHGGAGPGCAYVGGETQADSGCPLESEPTGPAWNNSFHTGLLFFVSCLPPWLAPSFHLLSFGIRYFLSNLHLFL